MFFNVKLNFKVGFFWNFFDLSTPWFGHPKCHFRYPQNSQRHPFAFSDLKECSNQKKFQKKPTLKFNFTLKNMWASSSNFKLTFRLKSHWALMVVVMVMVMMMSRAGKVFNKYVVLSILALRDFKLYRKCAAGIFSGYMHFAPEKLRN